MAKYLQEHVLEAAKSNTSTSKRNKRIEVALDNNLIAPRVAASELWSSIIAQTKKK